MAGRRIDVRGTVQGVGFRPWVARLAEQLQLAGRVRNELGGVSIEVFGPPERLDGFLEELQADAPPSARIVEIRFTGIPEERIGGFEIEASRIDGDRALSIPPDLATCEACEREVFDPHDRRYRYCFTNCTACGPRFTIATGIPYDRVATTMARFEMCQACRAEYEDVRDRRFHAQPNACPECGPTLRWIDLDTDLAGLTDPLRTAAGALIQGGIVAVKGLGGFHLACSALDASAVSTLRERKRRDEKPFAVMVRDLREARAEAELTALEEQLLCSPERPIVLVERRKDASVVPDVSPDTPLLGLFLPYTTLHHLLLEAVGRPLVMTSANLSDEPICKDNDEAARRLRRIADGMLVHDRDIAMRCDDSVARVIAGTPTIMRRSRGFVPRPFMLPARIERPVLACGGHLKNTFCIAAGDTAYLGPHIGDLESVAALDFFEEAIDRMETILAVRPEVVAHDLHPGYLSTRYALTREGSKLVSVQHHHAHVVSATAEHGVHGPVLGLAFDGTGYGTDGTSWGGEFLHCFPGGFERLATFRSIRLPGGNLAMREVWRIAYALLDDAFDGAPPIDDLRLFDHVAGDAKGLVAQMLNRDINTPRAHGVGRYFDAFGALGLSRPVSSYEGQVAIAWDFAAVANHRDSYPFTIDLERTPIEIDMRPAVRAAVGDLRARVGAGIVSARFHNTLVDAACATTEAVLSELGPLPVTLTGGVFQNARLCLGIEGKLRKERRILRHREVPPGDGGIALGQALIADAFLGEKD